MKKLIVGIILYYNDFLIFFFIESLTSLQSFGYNFVHSFSPSFRDLESLSGHVANLLSKLLHSKWFWLTYSEVSLYL